MNMVAKKRIADPPNRGIGDLRNLSMGNYFLVTTTGTSTLGSE